MKQYSQRARTKACLKLLLIATLLIAAGCVKQERSAVGYEIKPSTQPRSQSLVNINVATAAELEALPGVGHALAERIVSHRDEYGRFRRVEHLLMVRGISDRKFREIEGFITVD